ncbi:MAG: cyclic lactone autoinducer peptide [Lachnospiraceae bacterium]
MKTKKILIEMSIKILSVCAFITTLFSASGLCFWIMYQEEIANNVKDKAIKKLKHDQKK